jgi:hypothetical protein
MPFKFKISKVFVIVLLTFVICNLSLVISVNAQGRAGTGGNNASGTNPLTTCTDLNDPEFNSLRPYPAEPCQTTISDTAKFCGNDLTLHQTVTVPYPGSGVCTTNNGKVTCKYNQSVDSSVVFNLTGANLPFMGNTENVPNSQTPTGTPLTDAEKMNGYVSWYLNGVMNRAEDGSLKTSDSKTTDPIITNYNLVNLSGPLNKLLPGAILDAQRIKTIDNAAAGQNHNQIAVCAQEEFLGIWGKTNPRECYDENNTDAKPDVYKLESWNGDLSALRAILNIINPLDAWNKRTPPLPWNFESEVLYQKAYSEWRGKSCAIVPIINKIICIDNPLIKNKWADLFPYIPLSSTEDLKGQITVDNASSATSSTVNGVTVSGVTFSGQVPSTLFFPHMKEATELASILQDTFVAESEQGNKAANPTDVSTSSTCNPVEVRSNKGDNLFATQLSGNLHYDVSFSCDFNPATPTTNQTCVQRCLFQALDPSACNSQCLTAPAAQSCTKDVYISLSTTGAIPKANDVWSQTVAGPQSIFKRIFPKTNVAGGVGQIIDIPASTNITYSGSGISSSNTDLKFPHIGGVSEYFLKGIQTMLRPKGYGEPITFKPTVASNTTGDICAIANKYNIPCCQLKGIISVETGATEDTPKTQFVGSGSCNGQPSCCNGNYCGPANISCSQYAGLTNGDNLDMCSYNDSAVLLSRAMLLALCQADHVCNSYDWSKWGDYVLQHYTIPDGDYTASAYFYGLVNGCRVTSCSQFRWGAGKGYCDYVKGYCDTGQALESKPDVRFCNQCNIDEMIPAGVPIDCSKY